MLPQDARHAAEEEIYTNLNQKIDQFLQLADYDWMASEPGAKASDYLVDLIAFLRSTFAVFTHLPVSMPRDGAHKGSRRFSGPRDFPDSLVRRWNARCWSLA